MPEEEEDKEPEEETPEEQETEEKNDTEEQEAESQETAETEEPEDKTAGGLELDHKLLAGFGIAAIIAAGLFFATNSGNLPVPGVSGDSSEMAFTPEKTFTYDFGEGTVHIYATGENSTHLKGVMKGEGPRSEQPLYQRFLINRQTLDMKATRNVRRPQLNSSDLQYRQMRGEILSGVFLATAGLNQTQRKNLVQPGESQVRGTKVVTTETELDGREAYKLNISNSEAIYISREKPYMTLEVEGGDRSLQLTDVEQEVPEAIKQAEPLETSGDTQEASCSKSTSGFSASDVRVADFGVTSQDSLALELRNAAADPVTVTGLEIIRPGETTQASINEEIEVGSSAAVQTSSGTVSSSEGCNSFDLTITYDLEDFEDMQVTGTIEGNFALQ